MADRVLSEGAYGVLLVAAAATGAGGSVDLETPRKTFTLQSVVTGAPATVSLKLQGSLDNTNWVDLATSTSTTGDAQYAVDKPFRYVRANLGTLTGGTSPKVTAYFAAV